MRFNSVNKGLCILKIFLFSISIIMFVSCVGRVEKVKNTVIFTNINTDLGDVFVLLKINGKIYDIRTISRFKEMNIASFKDSRNKRFDEIVFLAFPKKGVSINWVLGLEEKILDLPVLNDAQISLSSKIIYEFYQLDKTIIINWPFFIKEKATMKE